MIALLRGWLGWALGAIAAAGVALAGLILTRDDVPEEPAEPVALLEPEAVAPEGAEPGVAELEVTPEVAEVPAAQTPEPVAEAPAMEAPAFDVVRVSPEGAAVVAGHATPGSEITVLVEGVDMAQVATDGGGNFVALFDLDLSDKPRLMQLAAQLGDERIVSESTFIIEPMDAPVEMVAIPEAPTDPTVEAPATESAVVAEADPDAIAPQPDAAEEPQAPRVLKADRDGIVVVEDAQITGQKLSLDTISYDDAGAVTVAGRVTPEASVRVYLDNQAKGDATAGAEGRWSLILPDVEPGIYTLRVDELGPDGTVVARVESPFKREAPEQLAMASGLMGSTPAAEEPAEEATEEEVVAQEVAPVMDAETPDGESVETPSSSTVVVEVAKPQSAEPLLEPTASEPKEQASKTPETVKPPAPPTIVAETQVPDVLSPDVVAEAPTALSTTDSAPATTSPAINTPDAAPTPDQAPDAPPLVAITVQPGSTLWAIARERYGEGTLYVEVFDANREKIRDPDLIYPGQVFSLPQDLPSR